MTIKEFSDQFDILVNAYIRQYNPGIQDVLAFNEYEKSLYLSKAQEEFVISCYDGKNQYGYLFEHTEEDRRILDSLIKTVNLQPIQMDERLTPISENSYFYDLPDDLLFITYEMCKFSNQDDGCINGRKAMVVPTTQDEFHKIENNPFRQANDNRVLRLDYDDNTVELVSKHEIQQYTIRYISKPEPIVLVSLPENLSIDTVNEPNECKLDSSVHRRILDYAVRMALQNRSIGFNNN